VGRATFLDQSTLSLAQFVSGELGGGGDNPVAAAAADAAADDGSTVWSATSHDDGAVFEIAVATGGLTTLVTTRGAVDLAVDASHLYALGNGRVWRLPR
jgi:hypothetical protein